VLHFEFETARV